MFRGAAPRTPGARGQGRAALPGRAGPGGGCALLPAPSFGLVPRALPEPSSRGSVQAPRAGRRGRAQGHCGRRRLRPGLRGDAGAGGRRRGAGRGAPDSGIARRGWARARGAGAESGGAMNGGRGGGRGAELSPKWLLSRGRGAEPAGKPGCWIQRGGRAGRGGGGRRALRPRGPRPPQGRGPRETTTRRPRPTPAPFPRRVQTAGLEGEAGRAGRDRGLGPGPRSRGTGILASRAGWSPSSRTQPAVRPLSAGLPPDSGLNSPLRHRFPT